MTAVSLGARPPSVAIIDEHPITAVGIAVKLAEQGFTVAAVATAVESLAVACDAVVCDLRLPGRSGAAAVAFLVERGHRVLATSGVAGNEEVLDVIASGARGFVAKTAPVAGFMQAIRDVTEASYFVSAGLASLLVGDAELRPLGVDDLGETELAVLRRFEQGWSARQVSAALEAPDRTLAEVLSVVWARAADRRARLRPTPRERQLMLLIADGCSHKEAAAKMSISTLTVAGYLKIIKGKYLSAHPHALASITPLMAARRWAEEMGVDGEAGEEEKESTRAGRDRDRDAIDTRVAIDQYV
jgi:DNA-binding NarL/FixJ family response regulator